MHSTIESTVSRQGLNHDTIVAIATGSSPGGIGVVRLSGSKAHAIAKTITNSSLKPRFAHHREFLDTHRQPIDDGIVLFFPGPHSFTGEDVVELQGHGGTIILQLLLEQCLALGARQAEPGEFSERAFLNGRLDLAQAEAIADLIAARTQSAAKAAQATLRGEFSDEVNALANAIVSLRVYVEAAIDFPEEEVDFLAEGQVSEQLKTLLTQASALNKAARNGVLLQKGATLVIAGRPNAGKSSLINRLAGDDIAIVTPVAGTTRDTIREDIEINGIPLRIIDTAGIRESSDVVEQEGVRRAQNEIKRADLVLHVIDDSDAHDAALSSIDAPTLHVINKIDLTGRPPGIAPDNTHFALSTLTGEGISELKNHLAQKLSGGFQQQSPFSARARHLVALSETIRQLDSAHHAFLASGAGELLAEDLKDAHHRLGEITGRWTSDQLLGEIFSSFCIGK